MSWLLLEYFDLFNLSAFEEVSVNDASRDVLRDIAKPNLSYSHVLSLQLLALNYERHVSS